MKTKMINLTPHNVVLRGVEGDIELPSTGLARVKSESGEKLEERGCISLYAAPNWGEVEGLPAPASGMIYIVSALVAGKCGGREDVFSPGTGPSDGAVRNEKGHIVAVTRLVQAPR